MKLVIFIPFNPTGGSLKSLRQLLSCWAADSALSAARIVVHATRSAWEKLVDSIPPTSRIELDEIPAGAVRGWRRLIYENVRASSRINALSPDAVYCPGGTVPAGISRPVVANFQNILPIQRDLWSLTRDVPFYVRQLMLRRLLRASLTRASHLIFNSHYSKTSFEAFTGQTLANADVIPRAMETPRPDDAAARRVLTELGIDGPYLISIGHIHAYRQYQEVVAGYARYLGQAKMRPPLLIVGSPTSAPETARLRRRLDALGIAEDVHLAGGLSYPATLALLSRSSGMLFSSIVENCPNALLEALALGVPSACARASSNPEFAKSAVLYVENGEAGWASAIAALLHDNSLRSRLAAAGPAAMEDAPDDRAVARTTWRAIQLAAAGESGICRPSDEAWTI